MNKLLIANRGEIALRIMRTAKRMGIRTVAIYSEIDKDSLHVAFADEAYCIGQRELSETYLNIPVIIACALETHCDAIHPGYGFLSENPDFVKACYKAGITFVGPGAEVMELMGNKIAARNFAISAGVPVTTGLSGTVEQILSEVDSIPFPVLVKAAAGGGGKGMRIVSNPADLPEALVTASREATSYFANGEVYIEQYLENPRHIEFQVLGDHHGNIIHLFERECSIQRRYQKIIEEAPSPTLKPELREKMGAAAFQLCKKAGYTSAGTIEFLADQHLNFYFLEMNTRIQVEHPVTELTTGIDIVEEQLLIASGHQLRYSQEELKQNGHAIECRIYAEDPANNFMPSPGEMYLYHEPSGQHIRVDSALKGRPVIHSFFDPMVAKLITWGENREEARIRALEALDNYIIQGIQTNVLYLKTLLLHDDFIQNRINTRYCDDNSSGMLEKMNDIRLTVPVDILLLCSVYATMVCQQNNSTPDPWRRIGYWRQVMKPAFELEGITYRPELRLIDNERIILEDRGEEREARFRKSREGLLEVHFDEHHYQVWYSVPSHERIFLTINSINFEVRRKDILPSQGEFSNPEGTSGNLGYVVSPMPGKVISVNVTEGDKVSKGDLLAIVEAMKMENNIQSPVDGIVDRIDVKPGMMVDGNTRLVHFRQNE